MALFRMKKEPINLFTTIFILTSIIVFIFSQNNSSVALFFSSPANAFSSDPFSLTKPLHYLRLFFHIFGNKTIVSLISNALFLFILAPSVEKKYSKTLLSGMCFLTALVSSSLTVAFFSNSIQGGTGIAFLYLLLNLIDSFEKQEFSPSLFFISILFLLREFYSAIEPAIDLGIDEKNLLSFVHFFGAFVASILAFIQGHTPKKRRSTKKTARAKKL